MHPRRKRLERRPCPRTPRAASSSPLQSTSLTLRGTAGTIRVDLARQSATIARPRGGPRRVALARMGAEQALQAGANLVGRVAGKLNGRLRGYPGLRALVAAFYQAVRDGLPPPVTFADGAAVVSVLERIRLHLETRQHAPRGTALRRRA